MIENLQGLGKLAVLTYVVSGMLVMGMSQRLGDVVEPLKHPRLVAIALAVNFIAAPLLALLLSRVIPLEPAHVIGFLLLASAAGSPFIGATAAHPYGEAELIVRRSLWNRKTKLKK